MKQLSRFFPYFLSLYHLAFAGVAWQYLLNNGGDAQRYWFMGTDLTEISWWGLLSPGTDAVKFLTYPLVSLGLPYGAGFFLFSAISLAGWLLLWQAVRDRTAGNTIGMAVGMVLLLLPNAHFWTSVIGKEPLFFLCMALLVVQISRERYFSPALIAAFAGMVLLRPHVAVVLFAAYAAALVLCGQLTKTQRLILLASGLAAVGGLAWMLSRMVDFSNGIVPVIRRWYGAHIEHFKTTDAYVPLDRYALPGKLLTFWFRPLPGEKPGLLYTVVSVENAVLLLLFGAGLYFGIRNFHRLRRNTAALFALLFLLVFGVMYAYAYANYGIIMRTRAMVLPVIVLLFLSLLSSSPSPETRR